MIDTNELRRLAQAATPGPWINHGRQPNVAGLPHSAVAAKTLLARVYSEAYGDVEQETANASFIAAANPAAISELLDRLEATEEDRSNFLVEMGKLCAQCGELRAKVAEMEKQEPAAEWTENSFHRYQQLNWADGYRAVIGEKLYALPGAQSKLDEIKTALQEEEEMSIKWIKYPRPGTSVLAGRWLVTVETGSTLTTDILQLEGGEWYWPDGSKLADRERVVAVAYVPEPYRPA